MMVFILFYCLFIQSCCRQSLIVWCDWWFRWCHHFEGQVLFLRELYEYVSPLFVWQDWLLYISKRPVCVCLFSSKDNLWHNNFWISDHPLWVRDYDYKWVDFYLWIPDCLFHLYQLMGVLKKLKKWWPVIFSLWWSEEAFHCVCVCLWDSVSGLTLYY